MINTYLQAEQTEPPVLAELALPAILPPAALHRLTLAQLAQALQDCAGESDPASLFMRLYGIFTVYGQYAEARQMIDKALLHSSLFRIHAPARPAIRLLLMCGAGDQMDNLPIDFLVQDSDIQVDLCFILPQQPGWQLPASFPQHDLVLTGLGEASRHRDSLQLMQQLQLHWPRRWLNPPASVGNCARERCCELLAGLDGLQTPKMQRTDRAGAMALTSLRNFPLIIRPTDSHAGRDLVRVDNAAELQQWLAGWPEAQQFYLGDWLDYRAADGYFYKYRIALIGGLPYLCHLAISKDWLVHYQTAGMADSDWKRAREAAAFEQFRNGMAARYAGLWAQISARLGLDYVVLDCAENSRGELIVFEADNGALVHAIDDLQLFPYKQMHMQSVFAAFRSYLLECI